MHCRQLPNPGCSNSGKLLILFILNTHLQRRCYAALVWRKSFGQDGHTDHLLFSIVSIDSLLGWDDVEQLLLLQPEYGTLQPRFGSWRQDPSGLPGMPLLFGFQAPISGMLGILPP